MKSSIFVRSLLIPLSGCILTSCETSGQLLTGGVCTCVLVLGFAVTALATSFNSLPASLPVANTQIPEQVKIPPINPSIKSK